MLFSTSLFNFARNHVYSERAAFANRPSRSWSAEIPREKNRWFDRTEWYSYNENGRVGDKDSRNVGVLDLLVLDPDFFCASVLLSWCWIDSEHNSLARLRNATSTATPLILEPLRASVTNAPIPDFPRTERELRLMSGVCRVLFDCPKHEKRQAGFGWINI